MVRGDDRVVRVRVGCLEGMTEALGVWQEG